MGYKIRYTFNGKKGTSPKTFRKKSTAREAIEKAKRAAKKGKDKYHYSKYKNLRIVKKK